MSVFGKVGWKVMTVAVGIPIGIAVRKGIDATWRKARPADPPRHPSDPDVTWQDAVMWGALSGLGLAVAQVVTNKGAAKAWRGLTGSEPPPKVAAEKHKAEEVAKAEKKEAAKAERKAKQEA